MPSLSPEIQVSTNTHEVPERRTGLMFPLGRTSSGGLARINGHKNDMKLIQLALLTTESDNPFQQPDRDIDESIYELDDAAAHAVIRNKLETIFADFTRQKRYKLMPETIEYRRDPQNEIFEVFLKYHNLEADRIEDLNLQVG